MTNLREDQLELLYEVKRRGGIDNVTVVSNTAVERVREALGAALKQQNGLRDSTVENMDLEALAAQFTADADEDAQNSSLSVLAHQHPETGGTPEHEAGENADDPEGVEALSAETRSEVKDKLERAETFDHRLPEHCENLRQEAVDLVPGAETVADIDLDEL